MNKKQDFINIAIKQVGDDYVWGANGPDEFDCSGLVVWCLQNIGVSFPDATANTIYVSRCYKIVENELSAGDLCFKYNGSKIYHVGIYLGENQVCEAKGKDYGVIISNLQTNDWNRYGRLVVLDSYDDVQVIRSDYYKIDVYSYLSFRKEPNGDKILKLYNNDIVKYMYEEKFNGNSLWFKVQYNNKIGWVASQFLIPIDDYVSFPEDTIDPPDYNDEILESFKEITSISLRLNEIVDILKDKMI